jgi:transcription initiation factor TFIID subunit 2
VLRAEQDPVGATAGMPMNAKKCKAILQTLKKSPYSIFFRVPVDPVLDGVPTYFEEIANPMDLSTIEKMVNQDVYGSKADFAADVELVLANCRQFNPVGTEPWRHADELGRLWRREWGRALAPRLTPGEKRALVALLHRLRTHPSSLLFREPVDPVALGIPTYFDVILPQDARDLSLIDSKLKSDKYPSIQAFDADIRLMLRNCRTFNAPDPAILALADSFDAYYRSQLAHAKQQAGTTAPPKRKTPPSTTNSPAKKPRSD